VWRTDFVAPSGAKLSISLDRNDDGSIWTRTEIDHIVRQQAELSRLGLQGPTDQFFAGRSAIEYGLTDPIGPVYDNLVFFPGSADLYTGDCKFSREQLVAFRDACARVIESLHLPPPPTQSPLPA
jgi:hypothetical protein